LSFLSAAFHIFGTPNYEWLLDFWGALGGSSLRVRFPMVLSAFFIDLILPYYGPVEETGTRNIFWG
jgi:hypothetical protein